MLKRSSKQLNEDRGCLAEKPSALLCGCPPGVCEDDCHGQQIFNLPGEGISDDPPGGDGTPSPSPLPDRGGRERRRVHEAQPSRPLDGCDHLPDDGSAATGKVAEGWVGSPTTIVNVSSSGAKIAIPLIGAYGSSKSGLEGMSDALRRKLMLFGIDIVILEPGTTNTQMYDKGE
jgi:hypothetical protein